MNLDVFKDKFKKGDYIVTAESKWATECAKEGYCFKQDKNSEYLSVEVDLSGYKANANSSLTADGKRDLPYWRYATDQEKAIYDEIRKPYDTRDIPKKGDYVTVITNDGRKAIAKYMEPNEGNDPLRFQGFLLSDMNNTKNDFLFFHRSGVCFAATERTWRKSDADEIAWLDACIKEGKFVKQSGIDYSKLEGRWVRAKINNPVAMAMAKGDHGRIEGGRLRVNGISWALPSEYFELKFDLMPENYEPWADDPGFTIKKTVHDGSGSMKKEESSINNKLNSKKNGTGKSVKVQRVTPTIREGERISGNRISGRTNKVAITSRPVVYQAIIGS
jgi:hypothetical protein